MEPSTFSVCVFIFYFLALCEASETCQKKTVCSCTFNNGSKVNLKPIDGGKTPSFQAIKGTDNRKFDWNPCTPFNIGKGCDNTMVCQTQLGMDENAGSKDSTEFSVESGNVVVTYGYQRGSTGYKSGNCAPTAFHQMAPASSDEPRGGGTSPSFSYLWSLSSRRSKITLVCDQKAGNGTIKKFTEEKDSGSKSSTYTATLHSKYACAIGGESSTGLSIGSILLIIFFPLLLLYIFAGILINYKGRGVRSMPEMLPNYSFWADVPFLVKDGAVFSYGAVRSACSELSSKFKKDSYAKI